MPVLPSGITEPLWDQFAALLPERVDPTRLAATVGASPSGTRVCFKSHSHSLIAAMHTVA
jgi:hypothetical protein